MNTGPNVLIWDAVMSWCKVLELGLWGCGMMEHLPLQPPCIKRHIGTRTLYRRFFNLAQARLTPPNVIVIDGRWLLLIVAEVVSCSWVLLIDDSSL